MKALPKIGVISNKDSRFNNVAKSTTFNNILSQFSLHDKVVLDIGCANGEFLRHFGKGSVGLTITPEEVEEGHRRGLDVRMANIEEDELLFDHKFDAIFANNIFEHMQSPHNFLIKIKAYLKEGGILILGVPCIPYISPLMRLRKFRGVLASLHINFFTRRTLMLTVEFAGWRVMQARGFRIRNRMLDYLLNPIYPHFYVVAQADPDFAYSPKRLKELAGYTKK
jgi:SAM-dependent methyltransferase